MFGGIFKFKKSGGATELLLGKGELEIICQVGNDNKMSSGVEVPNILPDFFLFIQITFIESLLYAKHSANSVWGKKLLIY